MPWIEMADRPKPGLAAQAREGHAWYRIRNAASDEAEVLLYDDIGGWFGSTADEFVAELKAVTAPKLRVKVNSPGGSVFEGLAIANALRAHPAEVTVQVDGLAASIASVIALAGDRLVMAPNSMLMIHEAAGGCVGDAAEMQQMAELLGKISDNIAGAYAEKAGGTVADWRGRMLAETWYNAQEAVDAGLADEVAPSRRRGAEPDAEPEMRNQWDLSVFRYAGREAAPAPTGLAGGRPVARASKGALTASIAASPPPVTAGATIRLELTDAQVDALVLDPLRRAVAERKAEHAAPGVRPAGAASVTNVLRQFDEGDRVRVVGQPHEPGHSEGVVAVVNGNAYGIVFDTPDDDTEPGKPYLWYVDNELEFVAEGADRAGDGYGEPEEPDEAAEPDEEPEPLLPGVSHPMGRPVPTGAALGGIVNKALPVHHTATVDEPWDGPAAVAAMPNDATVLEYCHAWMDSAADDGTTADDPDGDPDDSKSSYKFPHHKTKGGPANVAACRNGLARLDGADIPDGDKAGVRAHLQAHLDDAAKDDGAEDRAPASTTTQTPDDDPWAALTARITSKPSADDEFARLKEALL